MTLTVLHGARCECSLCLDVRHEHELIAKVDQRTASACAGWLVMEAARRHRLGLLPMTAAEEAEALVGGSWRKTLK